jgi:Sulfotransferase domain
VDRTGALPGFLIIGAARCGTTNFASYLRAQPDVFLAAKPPEAHYFLKDWEYEKGLEYYSQRYFSTVAGQTVVGEASTSYICHRKVAERIQSDLAGVKLVVMLRNPIMRAYSSYWYTARNGFESLPFLDALKAEPDRAAAATDPVAATIRPFAYVERGLYARQLRTFLEYFPRDRLHVILFDDFVADPKGVTCAALRYLGADAAHYVEPAPTDRDVNQATPGDKPMDDESFQFLRAAFRVEVHDLSALLDRDLTYWLDTATDAAPVYAAARQAA